MEAATQAVPSRAPQSGPVAAAQRRLADVVSVHSGLCRIIQAVEAGRLILAPGKVIRLRAGRDALADAIYEIEAELERIRRHERSVAP